MRYLILLLTSILIVTAIVFSHQLHSLSKIKTDYQYDYAEINMVNYGLFNLQQWKLRIIDIAQKRILDFQVSEEAYQDLETLFNAYINELYDDYIESGALINEIVANLEQGGNINPLFLNLIKENLGGQIKQLNLRSHIPQLTDRLSEEIKASEPVLIKYLQDEFLRLVMEGVQTNFRDRREVLYKKYNSNNLEDTRAYLSSELASLDKKIKNRIIWVLSLLFIALILYVSTRKMLPFREYILGLTTISIVLLVLGVTLPMIDIDARLNSFVLPLMGEEITFDEQILYFQSKSILDVTQTLLEGRGWDLKIVGVLIFLFSIVFPFSKLILSTLYLYYEKVRQSQIAHTVIFYLGKWSMADVFVVAMFMAYIGFYGLVTSQLSEIGRNPNGYAVETLNYSKLSPGALFFTSYCILSIVTSLIINRHEKNT